MANDFSGDASCKALWRLENGALTADSKGTNTLTASENPPVANTGDFREGAASADFEHDSVQYLTINDGDLDAGFPFKSGDANKKITVCCWVKPESWGSWANVWAKTNYWWGTNSVHMSINVGRVMVGWGHDGSNTDIDTGIELANGEWYHIAVVIDGVSKTLSVRVYRVSNDTVYTYSTSPAWEISVQNLPWRIGSFADSLSNTWDGLIDEVVVFDRCLSSTEIDDIREGIFSAAPPVNEIDVSQVLAQVEWADPPQIKVSQVIAQVEYDDTPPKLTVSQVIAQVEYDPYPPARRKFPVPTQHTLWQTQGYKRVFPVVP